MAIGGDENTRAELDALGCPGQGGHDRNRVVERELGQHGVGAVRRVGVLRLEAGGGEQVVEQPDGVVAELLGGAGDAQDVGAVGEGAGVWQVKAELHRRHTTRHRS